MLWISAPADSGIHFHKEDNTARPDQQSLIKFEDPISTPESYTAKVKYFVDSRASAEHSYLWLDAVASVKDINGSKVVDAGEILIPITIDTPLQKKLLVMVVIGIVVFLFITEWVRVDVVAIMVMVALPELGLLDPRLTFSGLSSNAVIANSRGDDY